MVELVIKGFKSEKEAEMFIDWYSGQGEQNAAYWFEEVAREHPVRDFIQVDEVHPENRKWSNERLIMVVK